MQGSKRAFLGVAAVMLALWTISAPAAAKRVALVVGNSDYRYTSGLRNPRNDASDMATALRRLGFSVISGTDLGVEGFYDKIAQFSAATRGASVALFFYAGHGIQVDGENYLAPVDAELREKFDLGRRAIALDDVIEAMQGETRLVFLDACRSNPFSRFMSRTRGASRGLARVHAGGGPANGGGTLIAFATAPDDVADDGTGRNSPFTAALLRHISAPGMSVTDMLTRVRKTVMDSTGGRQVPWSNDALLQVFHFVPPGGAETFAAPAPRCRFQVDNTEATEWSGRCIGGLAFGQGRATGQDWSYSGRAIDGEATGRGIFEMADGSRLEGTFRDGVMDGPGIAYMPDGSRMEGNFRHGAPDGPGTYYMPDGSRMEGSHIRGKLRGWVKIFYSNGLIAQGSIRDGKYSGQWFLDTPDGESCSAYIIGGDIKGAPWDCYP